MPPAPPWGLQGACCLFGGIKMKKYYIIRPDGSSIFELGYQKEFIYHCLIKLLDRTTEPLRLLCIDDTIKLASVQRDKAPTRRQSVSAVEPCGAENILTYILK